MKKIAWGVAITFILLALADATTTFWAVSIGFRESNPLVRPIAHTYWIFATILPEVLIGALLIRWAEQIPKVLTLLLISGLAIWMVLLVRAVIHNSQLISIFV